MCSLVIGFGLIAGDFAYEKVGNRQFDDCRLKGTHDKEICTMEQEFCGQTDHEYRKAIVILAWVTEHSETLV